MFTTVYGHHNHFTWSPFVFNNKESAVVFCDTRKYYTDHTMTTPWCKHKSSYCKSLSPNDAIRLKLYNLALELRKLEHAKNPFNTKNLGFCQHPMKGVLQCGHTIICP